MIKWAFGWITRTHPLTKDSGPLIVNKAVVQIQVPYLNSSDRGGAAAAVQQKVYDCPIPKLCKGTFPYIGLFEQGFQFCVRVDFLDGFLCLVERQIDRRKSFSIAPRKERFQRPGVTVYRVCGKPALPHACYHVLQVPLVQFCYVLLNIQVLGNRMEVERIGLQSFFGNALDFPGSEEVFEGFFHCSSLIQDFCGKNQADSFSVKM